MHYFSAELSDNSQLEENYVDEEIFNAVEVAIFQQLNEDRRSNPTPNEVMGDDLRYTKVDIVGFMAGVRDKLAKTGLKFTFSVNFAASVLSKSVSDTEIAVYGQTTR